MRPILTGLILILLLLGCTAPVSEGTTPAADKQQPTLNFDARVIYVALEGGFFGLQDEQGRHYLPDSIPPELRHNGQAVTVKAHPAPPSVGFRMWGQKIIIEEIEAR